MSVKPTKVPSIPSIPSDASPGLRRYLEALSEAVDIRLGRRGDQRDRAVTLRELVDSGMAVELQTRSFDPNQANPTFSAPSAQLQNQVDQPSPPTGFSASGGYELISLFWDLPRYRGHSLTEVWRHTADVIGDAQLLGVTGGTTFVDSVGESATYYYWVRHVNSLGNTGPFHDVNGELAQTSANTTLLLSELANQISESELTGALSGRIDLVDGPASLSGSVANQISQVVATSSEFDVGQGWNFSNSSLQGWSASDGTLTANGNTLTHTSTGNDPRIVQTGLSIDGAQNPIIRMSIKRVSTNTTSWEGRVWYTTANHGASNSYYKTIATDPTVVGQYAIVDWDMSQLNAGGNDWVTSTITGIRFDIASASGDEFEIQWIAVGSNNPSDYRAAVEVEASARTTADGALQAQYTVKIDNAGHVSGYGLASTTVDSTPLSEFGVRANQFWVAPPAIVQGTAPTANLYEGMVWVDNSGSENITYYYTGSAWDTSPQALPFVVQTTPTTLNGVTVPVGVYIDQAFIKDGSITNAKIGNATIDKAKIASLDADDIVAGTMSADRLSIDNIGLDTDNGQLILRSGGIFVDNLSIDSVGVVKFSLNNALISTSMQSEAFSTFTASSPLHEATVTETEPGGGSTTITYTLPEILELTLNNGTGSTANDDLKEGNSDYYIDFGAAPIGAASNSSSTSSSALVLAVFSRTATSTGSYSYVSGFGTHNIQNGALPLVPISHMVKVSLDKANDYKIKLYGYSKGLNENSATTGFSSRYIRLFRIAKASA